MCLATAYWAGLDGLFYGALTSDSKKYGGFDDTFIYEECSRPVAARKLSETMLLRDEAVKVWKEYAALGNNIPY
jgi:tRNA(Arg) A34 adenosine deaminase TadA